MSRSHIHRAAAAVLLSAACADPIAAPRAASPSPSPRAAIAPNAGGVSADTSGTQVTTFAWLTPTVPTQPASFADAFDAAATASLAVEVCALDAAGTVCAGAPVARYTATTTPYAQQIRADTVRQFDLVYWNTAVSAGAPIAVGRYRARVLDGTRPVGALDVQVVANAADAAKVDRALYAPVVKGQQLTLRFRVGRSTLVDPTVSADTVQLIAEQLYATLDAGIDATTGVHDVLAMLMPVLDAAQQSQVDARLGAGLPTAFDFQTELVGRAFDERARASVASFVAAAVDQGATLQGGAPLTVAALTSALQPVVGMARYHAEDVVPALVVALGQVRAAHAGVPPTPVWGDDQLDPLQTTLLMYALHYSGLDAATPPAGFLLAPSAAGMPTLSRGLVPNGGPRRGLGGSPVGGGAWIAAKATKFAGSALRGWVTGRIGKAVEMPLTWGQAASTSACASVLLNSYRFAVAAAPTLLGRIGLPLPTTSAITADLTFDFVPNAWGAFALGKAGCVLPPNGAAPNKNVQWTVGAGLQPHGALAQSSSSTDATGRAKATFATVAEVVPPELRTLAIDATGTIDIRATGLVPGWKRLERSVGVGVLNPTDAGVRLQVRHYEWPGTIMVDFSVGLATPLLRPTLTHHTTVVGQIVMPREDHDGVIEYWAEGAYAYTDYHMSGSFGAPCTAVPTSTEPGNIGFAIVAQAPGQTEPLSATPYPTLPIGIEHFNLLCNPGGTFPDLIGGFGTMLAATYMPIAPGLTHARSNRPLTDWQIVQPGVLRQVVDRTIPGPVGPLVEHSVYTLRLTP
ncbi:MAG: hypothetical protein JO180_10055 [Gemmatirosa sp.]|nr:hypothetical protein [Gemmatirosa sp.]